MNEKSENSKSFKTILIAEDELANYHYLLELLEEFELEVLYAENGKVAIETCLNHKEIDLIFMDIKMPLLDGYEATKIIKQTFPQLPVIAQTAFALQSERNLYGDIFDDYITKPIDSEIFTNMVSKYLKK